MCGAVVATIACVMSGILVVYHLFWIRAPPRTNEGTNPLFVRVRSCVFVCVCVSDRLGWVWWEEDSSGNLREPRGSAKKKSGWPILLG